MGTLVLLELREMLVILERGDCLDQKEREEPLASLESLVDLEQE